MKYHYLFLPVVVLITNSLILSSLTLSRSYAHMSIVPCKNLKAKEPDFLFLFLVQYEHKYHFLSEIVTEEL